MIIDDSNPPFVGQQSLVTEDELPVLVMATVFVASPVVIFVSPDVLLLASLFPVSADVSTLLFVSEVLVCSDVVVCSCWTETSLLDPSPLPVNSSSRPRTVTTCVKKSRSNTNSAKVRLNIIDTMGQITLLVSHEFS